MSQGIFDLYTDFLMASFRITAATTLEELTGGEISHDRITRFLRFEEIGAKELWKFAKPFVREIESDDGVLIVDDTISEKPYTDENEIICWHWDHSKQRNSKGINFVNCVYLSKGITVPVDCELVKKTKMVSDKETGKPKRISERSKNEIFRDLIQRSNRKNIKFRLVLADSWYSSAENMMFVYHKIRKDFIFPLKSNRNIALSKKEKAKGHWVPLESVKIKKDEVLTIYLEGVDFPLRFIKQIFKNEDGSTGIIYLVSSMKDATYDDMTTNYQKRWKVEEYHKSLKQNLSLSKSPTKTVKTQSNHLFTSLCAFVKLQRISLSVKANHFAIKNRLYMRALKNAYLELREIDGFCVR